MRKQNADDDSSIPRKDTGHARRRSRAPLRRADCESLRERARARAHSKRGARRVINEKLYAPSPKVPLG